MKKVQMGIIGAGVHMKSHISQLNPTKVELAGVFDPTVSSIEQLIYRRNLESKKALEILGSDMDKAVLKNLI